MFQFFPEKTNIDFIGKRAYAYAVTTVLTLLGIFSLFYHGGLNYGVDFRGGTNVQIKFKEAFNLNELREALSQQKLGEFSLQSFGKVEDHEVILALPMDSAFGTGDTLSSNLKKSLEGKFTGLEIRRIETIGPKVGAELRTKALLATIVALGLIFVYVAFRFEWRFAVGALVALAHDGFMALTVISVLDREFTLQVLAALLTVLGYSINDTIVVFDRVRENRARYRKKSLLEIINLSTNEMLSRTILTAGTVLIVALALFFFGGEIIHDFSLAMLVGVTTGVYSSVYIAGAIALWLTDRFPPQSKAISTAST